MELTEDERNLLQGYETRVKNQLRVARALIDNWEYYSTSDLHWEFTLLARKLSVPADMVSEVYWEIIRRKRQKS